VQCNRVCTTSARVRFLSREIFPPPARRWTGQPKDGEHAEEMDTISNRALVYTTVTLMCHRISISIHVAAHWGPPVVRSISSVTLDRYESRLAELDTLRARSRCTTRSLVHATCI
jgi:hypothetical protein